MIRIGTGGYNHREWIGSFYPVGMGPARYLSRYAEDLTVCELPLSSYRMPQGVDAERILGEAGGRLFFTALAPVRLVEAIRSAGAADLPSVGAGFLLGEGSPEIRGRDYSPERRPGHSPDRPAYERSKKSPMRRMPSGEERFDGSRYGRSDRSDDRAASASSRERSADRTASAPWLRSRAEGASTGARSDDRVASAFTGGRSVNTSDAESLNAGSSHAGSLNATANASAVLDRLLVRMREALDPYAKAGVFGGLVLPLPADVAATEEVLAAIARVRDRLEGLPVLIEPRDASWVDAKVLDFFRGVGLGFVLADGPGPEGPSFGPDRGRPRPLPARQHVSFVPLTADTAYVRFQGRDGQTRRAGRARGRSTGHENGPLEGSVSRDSVHPHGFHPSIRRHGSRRYETNPVGFPSNPSCYFYSWEELVGWLPTLRALASRAKDLYIVFDNPGLGSALENARMLSRLLGTVQPEGKATGS